MRGFPSKIKINNLDDGSRIWGYFWKIKVHITARLHKTDNHIWGNFGTELEQSDSDKGRKKPIFEFGREFDKSNPYMKFGSNPVIND